MNCNHTEALEPLRLRHVLVMDAVNYTTRHGATEVDRWNAHRGSLVLFETQRAEARQFVERICPDHYAHRR